MFFALFKNLGIGGLVVAGYRVAMDTSFLLTDHFPAPPTFRHQLASSSIADEFNSYFIPDYRIIWAF